MAKCFLRLDNRRALKDGTYPIQVAVGYGTNIYMSTGISIPMDSWDATNAQCVGRNAKKINRIINNALAKITNRVIELQEDGIFPKLSRGQLKQMLADLDLTEIPLSVKKKTSVGDMFLRVIDLKQGRTREAFEYTYKKIMGFRDIRKVPFEDITKLWLTEFITYMSDLAPNTQSIHMRNLRNVFNLAIDEGITNNYPFRRFSIPTQATIKRSLTIDELRLLINYPVDPFQKKYLDAFKLIFYLIGINVADLVNLREINNGRIEFNRCKTDRLYSIKVEPEAAEIINRYRGREFLLDVRDHYKNHRDYLHRLNENLQRIGPITYGPRAMKVYSPIFPQLTTYWARHTWATIAASLEIPKETIAAALGHGGNTVTDIYIDFNRDKIDAANRKVLNYVLYNIK